MIKLKWPFGWILIQSDWCPYKKRKLGQTNISDMSSKKKKKIENTARKWPPAGQGDTKVWAKPSEDTKPADIDLGLLASWTVKK